MSFSVYACAIIQLIIYTITVWIRQDNLSLSTWIMPQYKGIKTNHVPVKTYCHYSNCSPSANPAMISQAKRHWDNIKTYSQGSVHGSVVPYRVLSGWSLIDEMEVLCEAQAHQSQIQRPFKYMATMVFDNETYCQT